MPLTEDQDVDRTGQLLRHAVFFSFKDESTPEDIQGVADAFAALPNKIRVRGSERGLSPEMSFDSILLCLHDRHHALRPPHQDHDHQTDIGNQRQLWF